jgi:hypothetical protein
MVRARGFTLIEFLLVAVCVLVVLRIVFAGDLRGYERQLFDAVGLRGDAKLLLGVPLAIALLYWRFGRASARERLEATAVPSWLVWGGAVVIVLGVGATAWMFAT